MKLNGDTVKGPIPRIKYLIYCLKLNLSKPNLKPPITPIKIRRDDRFTKTGTPSRRLCNLFWNQIDWRKLATSLQCKIQILDIGAGSGSYHEIFCDIMGKELGKYTGLDLVKHPEWPSHLTHLCLSAEDAYKNIDNVNVVVSQSALEHIEHDVATVLSITQRCKEENRKLIQIHLVPGPWVLFLYLWHGWRQYGLKEIAHFRQLILDEDETVRISLIPIGSLTAALTHFMFVTVPSYTPIVRRRARWDDPKSITSKIIDISVNRNLNVTSNFPIFWALIIHNIETLEVEDIIKN